MAILKCATAPGAVLAPVTPPPKEAGEAPPMSQEPLAKEDPATIDVAAHRWRRRHGRATLDVILWPTKIDARLETEAGPGRIGGLAVENPRIRV
jgi:hypothetical protein